MSYNQCFAYQNLERQIGDQCKSYIKLHPHGDLGSIPGMYHLDEYRERKPSVATSDFLRGGIISTMATFEAFIEDLLIEACDTIIYERKSCPDSCRKCEELEYEHVKEETKRAQPAEEYQELHKMWDESEKPSEKIPCNTWRNKVLFHIWDGQYSRYLKQHTQVHLETVAETISGDLQSKNATEVRVNYYHMSLKSLPFTTTDTKVITKTLVNSLQERGKKETELEVNFYRNGQFVKNYSYVKPKTDDTVHEKMSLQQRQCFANSIIEQGFINYTYPIRNGHLSKVVISDNAPLCAILKLFYGIRNVMAHGNAGMTLRTGVLSRFPECDRCKLQHNPSQDILTDSFKLSSWLDSHISQLEDIEEKRSVKRIPRKEVYKKMAKEGTDMEEIIDKYFKGKEQDQCLKDGKDYFAEIKELDGSFAYFHMCRVHHWLKENERGMYITYGLLVRLNQFILLLAHRIYLAVAKILMEEHGLEDGIWGVPKENAKVKEMIRKFEDDHHKRVKELRQHLNPALESSNYKGIAAS